MPKIYIKINVMTITASVKTAGVIWQYEGEPLLSSHLRYWHLYYQDNIC